MEKIICIQIGASIWQGTEAEFHAQLRGQGTPIPSYRRAATPEPE